MMAVVVIYLLVILVLLIIPMWKIYAKAGKPGWASIVPIYNVLVMLEIVQKPWWWIFMFCIPIVNIVFLIMMYDALSKAFGQSSGFTVGLILLSFIFLPILGYGSATYQLK